MITGRGWIAVAALAAAGCGTMASSQSGATATARTGDEAHSEIVRLEERIARLDRKLGLPSLPIEQAGGEPAAAPPGAPGAPVVKADSSIAPTPDEENPVAPKEAPMKPSVAAAPRSPAPPAVPPPALTTTPAPAEPMRTNDVATVELASSAHRRSSRCRSVDRAAGEICEASDRICRLAGELSGEVEAARSCTRSRSECTRARDLAGGCQ